MTESAKLFTRPFGLLVLGHLLQALGWSSMLLLPLFVRELGASNAELGSVMATAAIGGLLFRPAAGWCLDRLGRKPTLIGATLILAGAMGMLGVVTDLGPTLFAARFLIGVGAGTLMTGYFTFVADFIPDSRRTEGPRAVWHLRPLPDRRERDNTPYGHRAG